MTKSPHRHLAVESVPISKPKAYSRNARTHSKKQIAQIADSMRTFGWMVPILIDENDNVIAGHGRLAAAKLLGLEQTPVIRIRDMSEAQLRAYRLADNKLALNAGWDDEILAEELKALLDIELNLDIGIIGFSIAEIDGLVEGLSVVEPGDPAEDIVPNEAPARCCSGDMWQLGSHRLACGSALDAGVVASLMNGEQAAMAFTDPPYNVPIYGHVGGSGKNRHREFAMASGEMSKAEFTAFLHTAFQNLAANSINGSIHFICMDWRHMEEMAAASDGVYAELKNLIVWAKDNGGMGSFYRSRHELIFAYKHGTAPHINTFELGQHGRYRTNVWQYRGVNTLKAGRMDELSLHPTVKPVQMIADAIKDVSSRGGVVLDLFGGSGSTLIAAHKTGRRGYLVELDPVYCDRIISRWEAYAKDEAVLVVRGGVV